MNAVSIDRKDCSCPLCGGASYRSKGKVKHFMPEKVGGLNINPKGVTFELLACDACGFTWKTPPLDGELLLKGYEQAPADHWAAEENGHERQFDYMEEMVRARAPGKSILDVGCFNGELLRHFGDRWQRFGVEPSIPAAKAAGTKGVEILGPTIESLESEKHSFDCIVAVDVVEHLPSPRDFFERASRLLKPGGVLLIVTGDTDARAWRLYGSHYWYCSYIGHIQLHEQAIRGMGGESMRAGCRSL